MRFGCLSGGSEGRDRLCAGLEKEGSRKKEWQAGRSEVGGRLGVRARGRGWEVVGEEEGQLAIRYPPTAPGP